MTQSQEDRPQPDHATGSQSTANRTLSPSSATEAIAEAPLLALAGGIAAGALLAALLPRTESEKKLLGPVGDRLTGTAKAAASAARDAGTARLTELGLTKEAGVETLRSILKGAGDAARTSAEAAVGTVRGRD